MIAQLIVIESLVNKQLCSDCASDLLPNRLTIFYRHLFIWISFDWTRYALLAEVRLLSERTDNMIMSIAFFNFFVIDYNIKYDIACILKYFDDAINIEVRNDSTDSTSFFLSVKNKHKSRYRKTEDYI